MQNSSTRVLYGQLSIVQTVDPPVRRVASDYKSKVFFGKIHIDAVGGMREEYNILGVPIVMAFKKGNPVARIEGLRNIDDYDSWIDSIHKGIRPMIINAGPTSEL